MSRGRRNDEENNKKEKEEGGGGWASTFLKVAGVAVTTAAVAGSLYNLLKQPEEAEVTPLQVRRTDHQEEVFILNVDGSHLPLTPSTGCGGYLSSASEKWICGFAQKLDPTLTLGVDEAEKEAILRGLLWVKEKGKRKVMVKSDRKGTVNLVNSAGGKPQDLLISDIRALFNNPHWEATLTWTCGKSNKVANKLADEAHNLTSFDLYEFDDAPENCVSLL
ncbi:uncharacterized protein [Medicago truncatula]|uniref:uncharacterized protein n=1 Tax=Medicago truncatula TaxID=3880 RepID=UPI000D2F4702|nr:uncharacterized protein LOC112418648 [Medicago truncatula]